MMAASGSFGNRVRNGPYSWRKISGYLQRTNACRGGVEGFGKLIGTGKR